MVSIRKELSGYGLTPRKKWGQNFLVDRNILHKIVREARIGKEDTVLEIGPGLGEMTRVLADAARRVIAIEVDPKLVAILEEKLASSPNVRVIHGDVLKIDFLRCSVKKQNL
jgi:16S rRNA (adenine1518-N6/adenine1519-N6)-dimethyltransferase